MADHPRSGAGFTLEPLWIFFGRGQRFARCATTAPTGVTTVLLVLAKRLRRVGTSLVGRHGLALTARQRRQCRRRQQQPPSWARARRALARLVPLGHGPQHCERATGLAFVLIGRHGALRTLIGLGRVSQVRGDRQIDTAIEVFDGAVGVGVDVELEDFGG